MNQPWVYMCSPTWPSLPPPSPSHSSGSSQCTSPEHSVSCIEPGLVICFTYDNIHVPILFFQIIPPSPSPTESESLFFTSVSLLLSHIYGHRYHLSKFHIYVLIYCIGVFLSGYGMLGADALGWPRGMVWVGRWEGCSGLGTCVHPWRIHVDVWQNQYTIVK